MNALSWTYSPVTIILLVLTTLVSLLAFYNPSLSRFMSLTPFRMVRQKEYHALITSGFVHANFVHLLLNMMVLLFFGPYLEEILDSPQFLLVYMFSLICGSIYPMIKYRDRPEYVAVGASGAISGIVFAFCLFEPMVPIRLILIPIPMPAFVFAILYTLYSFFAMKRMNDNIGHEAHLAGAAGGLIMAIALHPEAVGDLISNITG